MNPARPNFPWSGFGPSTSSSLLQHPAGDAALTPIEEALKASLSSPVFLDVKFFAFSRRSYTEDGTIVVAKPRPVLAIGSVLQRNEYFDKLLSSGFSESTRRGTLDSPFPSDEKAFTDDYDYGDDSDLDDDDLEEDPGPEAALENSSAGKSRVSNDQQCRQIVLKDTAHQTLRAFVFYLYTKKFQFLPLKSENKESRATAITRSFTDPKSVPPCSPKSMYRLADKYGLIELREYAYNAIRDRLSTKNIVEEVFSKFTSNYDRILELEINFLSLHRNELGDSLGGITDRIVSGELPHAAEVLKRLIGVPYAGRAHPGTGSGFSSAGGFGLPAAGRISGAVMPPPLQPQFPQWATFTPAAGTGSEFEFGDD